MSLTVFLCLGMILKKLPDNALKIIGSLRAEDFDAEKGHHFRSHGQQDEAPDGALQLEQHLGELRAEKQLR